MVGSDPADRGARMTLHTPHLLAPEDGEHWSFLNTNMTVKVDGARSGGVMTVIEALMPPGFGPPPHIHDREDELFFVLEGELLLWCDGAEATYGPGGTAWLPKGLAHRFEVVSPEPARMLQVTTPAQFEDFVKAVGSPMDRFELPTPSEPDIEALVRISADFGIEILGGPPPS